jgi:AcrR family transcriptional regulator
MKAKLLDAAEAEFAARGFEAARLEDIAAACGMRRASLLYHFESKQALYENVLERAFGDLGRMMASALARPTASYTERLDDVIGRLIDDFVKRPLFARLILRDTLDQDGMSAERGRRFVSPLLDLGDAFIRGGQATGEFRSDLEPRALLMLFAGSIIFHAASCDAVRDILWDSNVHGYREQMRSMMRALVLPTNITATKKPKKTVKEATR